MRNSSLVGLLAIAMCLINSTPVAAQEENRDREASNVKVAVESTTEIDSTLIKKIEVTGATVFSDVELAKVLVAYQGKELSFAQMLEARSKVTELYVKSGYTNSGAYLPVQDMKDGTLKIAVLEGGVSEIRINGTKHLNASYVRSRLPSAKESPVNMTALLDDLQLLRQDPLIENVSAELKAGVRPGESRLDLTVEESDSFSITAQLDNRKSPSTGSFRHNRSAIVELENKNRELIDLKDLEIQRIVDRNGKVSQPNEGINYVPGVGVEWYVRLDDETWRKLNEYAERVGSATLGGAIARLLEKS
jgi:hemolysin activation/secretion protein